ncbi:MAG: hypothetical protein R6V67_09250, partial [Spirochaetia bacterium]
MPSNARFPLTAEGGDTAAILWHEFQESDGEVESVSLSLAVKTSEMEEWSFFEEAIGPYNYEGEMVSIASLAVTDEGEVFVAAAGTGQKIDIFTHEAESDGGEEENSEREAESDGTEADTKDPEDSFEGGGFIQTGTAGKVGAAEITVAPRLFAKEDGGLLLFVTSPFGVSELSQIGAGSLGISYSTSSDGREWNEFFPLARGADLSYIYLPHHVSYKGSEYVVFQASPSESRFFQ